MNDSYFHPTSSSDFDSFIVPLIISMVRVVVFLHSKWVLLFYYSFILCHTMTKTGKTLKMKDTCSRNITICTFSLSPLQSVALAVDPQPVSLLIDPEKRDERNKMTMFRSVIRCVSHVQVLLVTRPSESTSCDGISGRTDEIITWGVRD